MIRIMTAALILIAQAAPVSAAPVCSGANPALVTVGVSGMNAQGGLNMYNLGGTVVNMGRTDQASNTLQFVAIYKDGVKLDERSIPPLKAGQSYAFSYVATRSRTAGSGTTKLAFQLDQRRSFDGSPNCVVDVARQSVTF
jgi:hypothetical protein